MPRTLSAIVLCLMGCGGICQAQSSFQDLTPGTSSRQDVVAAFGQPTRVVRPGFEIYAGPAGIQQVEVEYAASGLVDRLDVVLQQPVTRRALIERFGLPNEALSQKQSVDGKLIEYFGTPSLVAFVYASGDVAGGVARISHYSPAMFSAAAGVPAPAAQPVATSAADAMGGARACFAQDRGVHVTDDSESLWWAREQQRAVLMPIITAKIEMLFQCPALTDDQLSSAYADLSRVRSWDRAPLSDACFGGDRGVLNASWAAHKAYAKSRSRAALSRAMQWKVGAAFTCLRSDRPWQNYLIGDISAAIARAAGF